MATATETPRAAREEAKAPDNAKATDAKEKDKDKEKESPPAASGGGIKPWLPLIIAVVAMPALAFVTTQFVLLPKLTKGLALAKPGEGQAAAASSEGAKGDGKGEGKGASNKNKITVSMNKMLVNVAGTMGTRYLMTSITLVGTDSDFKSKIDDNKEQLTDLATGTLSGKTISDLEKPGARNEIRTELITVFNNSLGGPLVQEIYITELAIQ